MSDLSAFDTIGPVMVGPSSSHTAGAVRIGNLAREIVGVEFKQVKVFLHGSFKETYQGHGTDKALIGGLLGLSTENSSIKESFKLAQEEGIEFEFIPTDLDDVHPNTVKLEVEDINGKVTTIVGSSVGGGSVVITELDGIEVKLSGKYPTLMTLHKDMPGMIAKIGEILMNHNINIAFMEVIRRERKVKATAIIKLDQELKPSAVDLIAGVAGVDAVKTITPIQ